jgi:DNA polymerase III alpha subunit
MIPLFKSHFSIGKSILTLAEPEKQKKDGPDSILSLALDNGLKELYLVEDSLTGFLTAFKICQKYDLSLRFGLRISICNDYQSIESSKSKLVLFALNDQGFKDINKIYTFAHTKNDGLISNDDLTSRLNPNIFVCVPFYDSYVWNNYHYFNNCTPFFLDSIDHAYLAENNKLPFDDIISKVIKSKGKQVIEAKSIYYKNREDYEAWITYKIACSGTMGRSRTLSAPDLSDCGSKEFSFQSWKEAS